MTTSNYPDNPTLGSLGSEAGSTAAGAQETGAKGQAKQAAGTAADQAKQTAGTAADQGRQVADVAQGEAKKVASEASTQVRGLLHETTTQLEDQGRTQRDRLVEVLRSFGDDLDTMASSADNTMASNLAHEVADRSRGLSRQLDGREPRELLEDVRSFARRKPGAFLAGSLIAGVIAGRLARGAKDAGGSSSGSPVSSGSPTYASPTYGSPTYGSDPVSTDYVSDPSVRDIDPGDPLARPRVGEADYPTTFQDRP